MRALHSRATAEAPTRLKKGHQPPSMALRLTTTDNPAAEKLVDGALTEKKAELGLSSYELPELRWVIRNHLIELVSEFPDFLPSANGFTAHEDGRTRVLINAKGRLLLPVGSVPPLPPLHLALWLPRRYPHDRPMAFLSSPGPVDIAHPYLDSGSLQVTNAPYLVSWEFPFSNLADLVRCLVSAFELNPPFPALCSPRGRFALEQEEYGHAEDEHLALALAVDPDQPLVSWEDAAEELATRVHRDLGVVVTEYLETEDLAAKMRQRWIRASRAMSDLGRELIGLKTAVQRRNEHADVLVNWVKYNEMFLAESTEEVFTDADASDESSSPSSWDVFELEAHCVAIDDLLEALEKAVLEGVLSANYYLKQVRLQAKYQFFLRAKIKKLTKSITRDRPGSNVVESWSRTQQTVPKTIEEFEDAYGGEEIY